MVKIKMKGKVFYLPESDIQEMDEEEEGDTSAAITAEVIEDEPPAAVAVSEAEHVEQRVGDSTAAKPMDTSDTADKSPGRVTGDTSVYMDAEEAPQHVEGEEEVVGGEEVGEEEEEESMEMSEVIPPIENRVVTTAQFHHREDSSVDGSQRAKKDVSEERDDVDVDVDVNKENAPPVERAETPALTEEEVQRKIEEEVAAADEDESDSTTISSVDKTASRPIKREPKSSDDGDVEMEDDEAEVKNKKKNKV